MSHSCGCSHELLALHSILGSFDALGNCQEGPATLGSTVPATSLASGQCHRDNQSHLVTTSRYQSSQPAYTIYRYRVYGLSILFFQAPDS